MKTSVLFLIFNRPDTTQQVFNEIRKAKPKQLFIAADGPRENNKEDIRKCKEVRDIIKQVDWDCEIKTLLREKNLGCKYAVSEAIDWFFDNVEEGIILEDDCLPEHSFFKYCNRLLEEYNDDDRIMAISGCNHGITTNNNSYYFSKYVSIWGWATWKRAWEKYDLNMRFYPEFKKSNYIKYIFSDKQMQKDRIKKFDKAFSNQINTWDYQWNFCILANNGFCIKPNTNLIKNIGFTKDATHTKIQNIKQVTNELKFPLDKPNIIYADYKADIKYFKKQNSLIQKIKGIFK